VNGIFFALVIISFVTAAFRQLTWTAPAPVASGGEALMSPMEALGAGMVSAAESSVTLAIGLIGVMALFLGLMKVAEAGGLLVIIAKTVRPLMIRLFPEVPPDHPAMGAIILNMSANALGLGNAATPFGIRAMQELDSLNPNKGTATNAMALFLAINTSSITLLPTGVIALRAAAGSSDPAGILPTTLFATICSTTVAILVALLCQRYSSGGETAAGSSDEAAAGAVSTVPSVDDDPTGASAPVTETDALPVDAGEAYPTWVSFTVLGGILAMVPLTIAYGKTIAPWIIPGLMTAMLSFGVARKVPIYESFVEGAREGFSVAVRIIPYLVAILAAVAMFRASGALEAVISPLAKVTTLVGLPAEALPMALLRPLSGSGAYGILASIINDPAIGPDSYTGYLVSTFQGSTETTFYVLAVYFGAVGIRRIRHTLVAALSADVVGIMAAVAICLYLYGS
jgi:spore maturation protein SpmA